MDGQPPRQAWRGAVWHGSGLMPRRIDRRSLKWATIASLTHHAPANLRDQAGDPVTVEA
jgi:hypothetical protein